MESSITKRLEEFSLFERALTVQKGHDSELSQVLLTASYIDAQLRIIIEASFVASRVGKKLRARLLEGPNAPIGTFSARIQIAYAYGLISEEEYTSFDAIRGIRNAFAHELTTSFSDSGLTGQFDKLAWAAGQDAVGDLDRSQVLFLASVRLAMGLVNRADHVALAAPAEKEWPAHRTDVREDSDVDHLDRDVRDLDRSWFRDE